MGGQSSIISKDPNIFAYAVHAGQETASWFWVYAPNIDLNVYSEAHSKFYGELTISDFSHPEPGLQAHYRRDIINMTEQATSTTTTTTQARYVPGEFGNVDGCPSGYAVISSASLCQEVAEQFGYTWNGKGAWPADYPKCTVRPSTGDVWFNTHANPAGTWGTTTAGQFCTEESS